MQSNRPALYYMLAALSKKRLVPRAQAVGLHVSPSISALNQPRMPAKMAANDAEMAVPC